MYEGLCRLCSKPHNNEAIEIFSTNSELTLVNMIEECTRLILDKNDKLPLKMCIECNRKLDISYTFRRQCEYVDYKFRQGLGLSECDMIIKKEDYCIDNDENISINNKTEAEIGLISSIKKEVTESDEDFCPDSNTYTESTDSDQNSARSEKLLVKVATKNKVKMKKIPIKVKLQNNAEIKVRRRVCVKKNEMHMCYLCGALVKRIHSHMKNHRDAGKPKLKKFRCEKCGAAYSRLHSLNNHLKSHLEVKPLKCTLCEKRFIIKRYLDRHMRIHSGDRPWKCQFCTKAFQTKYNLNTHVRVHTREKPYKCQFCELCFRQRAALNTHVRTHNPDPTILHTNDC